MLTGNKVSRRGFLAATGGAVLALEAGPALAATELLNASYDPTRELYRDINAAFIAEWREKTGETITARSSHGGSGAQARAVIDGLPADVVTLALAPDIDAIAANTGKIPADWQTRLPNSSCPYTSTILLVVRKGNPKGIKDWDDLARPGVQVATPNPKTSGGARWNYIAAWGWALEKWGDEGRARELVAAIFRNAPVLDTGARGSTITFARRGLGDVLVSWENDAFLAFDEFGRGQFEIVAPTLSIKAEPPVTLVDGNVDARGTRKVAEGYLDFLYAPAAQTLVAKHHYRPFKPAASDTAFLDRLPKVQLFSLADTFGSWTDVQKKHFAAGGIFDSFNKPGP